MGGGDAGVGGEQMSESTGGSNRCWEERMSGTRLSASAAKQEPQHLESPLLWD